MSKVYLVNVGANMNHASIGAKPDLRQRSFRFRPLPPSGQTRQATILEERVAIRADTPAPTTRIFDPDWHNLTYGDCCGTRRARALCSVVENGHSSVLGAALADTGKTWDTFTDRRRWCLIGALRVREVLHGGQRPKDAKRSRVERARQNVHFYASKLDPGDRVFHRMHPTTRGFSARAVDLGNHKRLWPALQHHTHRQGADSPTQRQATLEQFLTRLPPRLGPR